MTAAARITVRTAVEADAPGIADVHVQAWREAYAHLLPAAFLSSLDPVARTTRWRRTIAGAGAAGTSVAVAEHDGVVVGWATAGPGRDEHSVRDVELTGISVLASAYGSGAGQMLLDAVLSDAPAFLWVADDNPRAQAFYARNGFRRDGATKTEHLGDNALVAARMVR
ncbi:GNAT family N-acetyltransferase [Curtobacterium sp. MCPF17_011]|uniref:GNAT family N-acetyltransferase n=1 Tax=unclassified Curtobacterium TaxID=257496 RepID=UPI000D9E4747|nr:MULTISPECIES: GNAT family N-acetyltransferase [unclassified Curtobacterium]PYY34807.1 GNAT family N-acetyltransferase [Curtobacterium sp. MCBD17_030]PZF15268.1 GNAT family N-acetyltransferase [Curtobacterium sp. MCPF17_011]